MNTEASIKAKQQRMQAVRKQEAAFARESSKNYREIKNVDNKIQTLVKNIQEQIKEQKESEIQNLIKQKEYCLNNLGKAQKQAEEEEKIIQEEIRAKERFQREAKIKQQERGVQAIRLEQENEAKRLHEENYLKEKRAEVIKIETELAHSLAVQYREKQKELEERKKEEEKLNYIRPGGVVMYGTIDYSKTCFHNPVILKHDFEGKTAKEIAIDEQEEALLRLQAKEETKINHQQKAEIRGSEALRKVSVDKQLDKLSKELEKIRVADGNKKIQKGMNDPVSQNRCITKNTQDNKRKQQELERKFEEIAFSSALDQGKNEDKNNPSWEVHNSEKSNVFEIPQPKIDESLNLRAKNTEEKNYKEKVSKEEKKIDKSPLPQKNIKASSNAVNEKIEQKAKIEKSVESSESDEVLSDSENFEISISEESSEGEILSAKYSSKISKKKKGSKKSNQKKTAKYNNFIEPVEEPSKVQGKKFNIKETKNFKDELENEYSKHLEIKQELESLKKFKNNQIEPRPKDLAPERKSKYEPPSVTSSQLSPNSPMFQQKIGEDANKFEKTSSFPIPESKNDDIFDIYSKFKNGLYSNTKQTKEIKKNQPEENSIDDEEGKDPEDNKKFFNELKAKYGIVSRNNIKPDENEEESSLQDENFEKTSQNSSLKEVSQEKNAPDLIFSERTLKLMKEIEEKYSLDKFKIADEEEDLRYAMPLSKPFNTWEEKKSNENTRGRSLDQYIDDEEEELSPKYSGGLEKREGEEEDEKEEEDDEEEKEEEDKEENSADFGYEENHDFLISNDTNSIDEKYLNPDKNIDKRITEEKSKKNENIKEKEEKPLYDKNFFDEIKNKYGFVSSSKPEKKEFSYKYEFEENYSVSEEKSIESDNLSKEFSSSNEEKNKKKNGIVMDFNEDKGKSLAELFNEKKKKVAESIDQREAKIPKAAHKEKTKEELLEIRKELLKGKAEKFLPLDIQNDTENSIKKVSNPVLERLGKGEKPKISKKDMHELTKKNYELLPEVQKKKEEDRKKQELRERIQKSKEFEKVIII